MNVDYKQPGGPAYCRVKGGIDRGVANAGWVPLGVRSLDWESCRARWACVDFKEVRPH